METLLELEEELGDDRDIEELEGPEHGPDSSCPIEYCENCAALDK